MQIQEQQNVFLKMQWTKDCAFEYTAHEITFKEFFKTI